MTTRPIRVPEEQDAYTRWRKRLSYLQRAGAVKSIKRRTHHRERRDGQHEIAEQRDA